MQPSFRHTPPSSLFSNSTTDNLTKAVYQFDLQRGGDITLNLDYATSGVGDTARGILGAYRAYPALYERTLCIRPVK